MLTDVLELERSHEPSDRQLEYLRDLFIEVGRKPPAGKYLASKALVGAWIDVLHAQRAELALRHLKITRGDVVSISGQSASEAEVSSISDDGTVNFLGGMGARARPHTLKVRMRAGQQGKARVAAENQAALRRDITLERHPSAPQMHHLEPWLVKDDVEKADVEILRSAVETASDERPLQAILTEQPQLLGSLLGGTYGDAVIPWPKLGGRFVPDFLLAEADSAGIHWTMVELESPRARVLLPDGRLAAKAREAVGQVRDWRRYLLDNIALARAPKGDNGLGLIGIRPERARGLVIIGRRREAETRPQTDREALAKDSLILVRSYDWLLDRVGGGLGQGAFAPLRTELRAAGVPADGRARD